MLRSPVRRTAASGGVAMPDTMVVAISDCAIVCPSDGTGAAWRDRHRISHGGPEVAPQNRRVRPARPRMLARWTLLSSTFGDGGGVGP
jgi:hypothetical protein